MTPPLRKRVTRKVKISVVDEKIQMKEEAHESRKKREKRKGPTSTVKQEVHSDEEQRAGSRAVARVKKEAADVVAVKRERVQEEEQSLSDGVTHERSDVNCSGIISSEEEEESAHESDDGAAALRDSDGEDDAIPAVVAALPGDDDAQSRPPPNKKHKCLQSEIITTRAISGADACSSGHPASLPLQKVKLHYVVHYLHRGAFNHIVPELQGDDRAKVEGYECNVCGKKFKNNVAKSEYPARGSFVCHLATEHGKILDAMRDDTEIDMSNVIELLKTYDKQFREFSITGTKTDKDDNLVTVKESLYWRMQHSAAAAKANGNNKDNTNTVSITPKSFYPQNKSAPQYPSFGGYFCCPKCDQMKRNRDRASLRIHLFQHYRERWADRLKRVAKDDAKEINCDACKKKVTGATVSGVRNSIVCHWAIQHDELKDALAEDNSITKEFTDRLYEDTKKKSLYAAAVAVNQSPNAAVAAVNQSPYAAAAAVNRSSTGFMPADRISVLSVFDKNDSVNSKIIVKKGRPPGSASSRPLKKSRKKGSSFLSDDDEDDIDDPSEEESEEDDMSLSGDSDRETKTARTAPDAKPAAGQLNANYVRKRTKINFTLDSDDEDSDEWSAGKKSAAKKKKKGNKVNDVGGSDSVPGFVEEADSVIKGRSMRPRRASAVRVKFLEESISDEEDI